MAIIVGGGGGGFTIGGPCCCGGGDFDVVTCFSLPDSVVSYANNILTFWINNGFCPSIGAAPPTDNATKINAMFNAYSAVMSVDFDNPPVPWSQSVVLPLSNMMGRATWRAIEGAYYQPIIGGPPSNPNRGLVDNPSVGAASYGSRFFSTVPLVCPSGPDSCFLNVSAAFFSERENPQGDVGQVGGLLCCCQILANDTTYSPSGGEEIFLNECGGVTTCVGFAQRVRWHHRQSTCVSWRKVHLDESSVLLNPITCGLIVGDGSIVSPRDPRGDQSPIPTFPPFDLAGISGSTPFGPDLWQEGACMWLNLACEDCTCP